MIRNHETTDTQQPATPTTGSNTAPVIVAVPGKPIINIRDVKSVAVIKDFIVEKIKETSSKAPVSFTDTSNHEVDRFGVEVP